MNGVVVPATVKLFRMPPCLLASLKRVSVCLVVKGVRKHRDHKQVDDEAENKESFDLSFSTCWHLIAMEMKDSREV